MKAANFFRYSISLILLIACGACSWPRNWHRVEPGMSKEDVIHFVGQPTRRSYEGDFTNGKHETWYYDYTEPHTRVFEPHVIQFLDTRVTSCAIDQARLAEYKSQRSRKNALADAAAEIPLDAGYHCDAGSQCQSGRCVGRKCAGPNDCTRVAGDECYSNLDCCSKQCNLGAHACL